MNDRYMGLVGFTLGKRFGASKRWGVIVGASYDYNGRGYNDIEPAPDLNPNDITSTTPYYDNLTLREYRHQRLRWGGTMGADYKLSDHSSSGRSLPPLRLQGLGRQVDLSRSQTDGKPKFKYSIRRPDFMIGSLSLGGNHILRQQVVHLGLLCLALARTQRRRQSGRRLRRQQRVEERAIGQLRLRRRPQWRPLPSAVVRALHGAEHRQPG